MSTFVDTNVLVYAVDRDEPSKQQRAIDVLEGLGPSFVLSAQVLGEFYVTVRRKLAATISETEAARLVDGFATLRVVALDAPLVAAAVDLSRTAQLSYWDALIVAAAGSAGCERILSEDLHHGHTIAGITVENPFR